MTVEVNKAETQFISHLAGNGLFAKEDLEAGDVIIRVKDPYVLTPRNDAIPSLCYGCLLETTELKSCSGCKTVKYCSKSCQKISWKDVHRLECKVFRTVKDNGHPILPTPVRGLIQVLLRHPTGVDLDLEWSHLETHKKFFMAKEQIWQDIQLQAAAALKYTGLPMNMMGIATSIMCLFKVNAFYAAQQDDAPMGLFFEPLFSTANHSCVANALISFDGRHVSFKALEPIRKGEEVTISYVDANQPLKTRQLQLQERYFFTCKCQKCTEDWDVYTTFLQNPCREANNSWMFSSYAKLETEARNAAATDSHGLADTYEVTTAIISKAMTENSPVATHMGLQLVYKRLREEHWGMVIAAMPYSIVLRPLIDNYVVADEIEAALVLLLASIFHIQPFEFPEPWNPIRVATLRSAATLISQILASPKYSLHRVRAIPSSLASEVELLPCVCAVLLLVAHYAPRSHGSASKLLKEVREGLADIERCATHIENTDCLAMLMTGIWDGNGSLAARKCFQQLEKLADINLMCDVIDSVDCAGNGHNEAFRPSS